MKELDEIEARWARVRDTKPGKGPRTPEHLEAIDASVCDVPDLVRALREVLTLPMYEVTERTSPDSAIDARGHNTALMEVAGVIEAALTPRPQITKEQVEAAAVAISHAVRGTALRYLNKFDADYVRSKAREALEAAAEVQR